ncbi:MAG: PKD domain-containing protein [Patescibacteria group bacterium]|jgi:hypothetical protein
MRNFFYRLAIVSLFLFPCIAHASNVDLSLEGNAISFSESALYAGEKIRIYARVRNVGDTDAVASVMFYQGGMIIGQSQAVSLRANGNPDDVYVDFTVPNGTFNIRAVLQGSLPQDMNPVNDATQTALFYPIVDADRDGSMDEEDNCVNDANADQLDTDHDDIGDVCDEDDDGDGVSDSSDQYPLDSSKSADPIVATIVAPAASMPSTEDVASSVDTEFVATDSQTVLPIEGIEEEIEISSTSAVSLLTTSPLARFSWKRIDWRTYEFILAQQPEESVQFSWDFGDGATSVQPQITHAFSGPGSYAVTLTILDETGKVLSDAQTFDVTFFHLGNPQVIGLIVLLFIILFLFGFAFMKLRSLYDKKTLYK